MEVLKKILIDNQWFTRQEVEELFTSEIQKCINECTRPSQSEIFNAFEGLKPQDVKVLIIGQDPYPDEAKAHGLAFSYKNESMPADDSLNNIFEKIESELKIKNKCTNLTSWKKQGVLLLNTALTYTKEESSDKYIKLWQPFVSQIINKLLSTKNPLVIMLWGRAANEIKQFAYKGKTKEEIYTKEYPNILILRSSHPSNNYQACTKPIYNGELSAFKDSRFKPFKECNEFLQAHNIDAINWSTYQP